MKDTIQIDFTADRLSEMISAIKFEHTAAINIVQQSYGEEKKSMQRRVQVENELLEYLNELEKGNPNSSKLYTCGLTYEQLCITIDCLLTAYKWRHKVEEAIPNEWAQMVEEANPKAVQLFDISERRQALSSQAKGDINNGKQ